jgi:hypothetical protein
MWDMTRRRRLATASRDQHWKAAFWLISKADMATPPALAALPGQITTPPLLPA